MKVDYDDREGELFDIWHFGFSVTPYPYTNDDDNWNRGEWGDDTNRHTFASLNKIEFIWVIYIGN